jgi:hypothetical protein
MDRHGFLLTGVHLGFMRVSSAATLFLRVNGVHYALTFRRGWYFNGVATSIGGLV